MKNLKVMNGYFVHYGTLQLLSRGEVFACETDMLWVRILSCSILKRNGHSMC